MSILRGEDVVIGVGAEAAAGRGTPVAPQIWVPGRSPSGIAPIVEKMAVKETRGTKIASHAAEIVQKRAEGDLDMNLRHTSIGYILKSLLGSVQSTPKSAPNAAVYDHTFSVLLQNPEHPSLTLGLSQPNVQDYRYRLAVATMLSLKFVPDDLISAVVSFIAAGEDEVGSPYTPDFVTIDDHLFRHQDCTIKIADNVAGLAAASAFLVKNLELEIGNGGRPDQNVSEEEIGNVLSVGFDPTGKFLLDYQNTDMHDVYTGATYKALQVTMERTDITIGSSAKPKMVITFPRISFPKWTPNRPIDDVVREEIEFMVHYDEDEEKAVEVVLTNTLTDYNADSES